MRRKVSKTRILHILSYILLAINVTVLFIIVVWPIINTTNHSSLEPYLWIMPFIIISLLSVLLGLLENKKNSRYLLALLVGILGIAILFSYKEFNIMLNHSEWMNKGGPGRFEKVTMNSLGRFNNLDSLEQTIKPFRFADSDNVANEYIDEHFSISYPSDWKYSTSVYAGNGMPHLVFCPSHNYNEDGQECKRSDPDEDYFLGKYLTPSIGVNHVHEEIDITTSNNIFYMGNDELGEYYISYRTGGLDQMDMKTTVFDMIKTFQVNLNPEIAEQQQLEIFTWKIKVEVNLPEREKISEEITQEYDESYVDYCHPAYSFIRIALGQNDIPFKYSEDGGIFSEIAGIRSSTDQKWTVYVQGLPSAYLPTEHCVEDGWEIELFYE